MAFQYIWLNANPEHRQLLRQANEARAAAYYAAWRATVRVLGAPFRRLAAAIRTAHRVRRTRDALAALGDHQLADIGLHRGEIAGIARAVAAEPAGARVALSDLPRLRDVAERRDVRARHPRPAPWSARPAPRRAAEPAEPGRRDRRAAA